jgi:hypothetical protein
MIKVVESSTEEGQKKNQNILLQREQKTFFSYTCELTYLIFTLKSNSNFIIVY